MRRQVVPTASFAVLALVLGPAVTTAAKPVAASRPSPHAHAARHVIVEVSRTVRTLYQGMRAGMFKGHVATNLISREIENLEKNKAVMAFLRDKSVTENERSERICRWIMGRSLKTDERKLIRKHLAKSKDRPRRHIEIIWAFANSAEFLLKKK